MNTQLAARTKNASNPLPDELLEPGLSPRSLGILGESYAEQWLTCRGWTILDRNWHTRYGELDIIATDTEGVIVFVEVKTRRNHRFGHPHEAVDFRKRRNLRRAGSQWLFDRTHCVTHNGVRFDVIGISVLGKTVYVNHVRSAF
ncbi:MAG: YraN family protein [Bifidobacterium sp.]|uniref:UPF0102 protein QN062_02035 n=1 Tax=Bifidobacterium fermentum TaxID=3059035 RepID=A0AB39UFS7_9BIFI